LTLTLAGHVVIATTICHWRRCSRSVMHVRWKRFTSFCGKFVHETMYQI